MYSASTPGSSPASTPSMPPVCRTKIADSAKFLEFYSLGMPFWEEWVSMAWTTQPFCGCTSPGVFYRNHTRDVDGNTPPAFVQCPEVDPMDCHQRIDRDIRDFNSSFVEENTQILEALLPVSDAQLLLRHSCHGNDIIRWQCHFNALMRAINFGQDHLSQGEFFDSQPEHPRSTRRPK